MKQSPIIFEQTLTVTPEEIWQAITDKEQMKEWYFDLSDFKPEPQFHFQFEGGTDTNKYIHLCTVVDAVPNQRLSYTWQYEGYEGSSLVIFDIIPHRNNTFIRLTHEGLETLPSSNPDFAKENFEAGWKHINTTLVFYYCL
jgi:uncharacterized protein YndB with AHSA1/START domain